MELRIRVKDSHYLLSAEEEMFGKTDYNYGFALPENLQLVLDSQSITLDRLVTGVPVNGEFQQVKTEEIELPADIDYDSDEYYERDYIYDEEIDDLSSLTFFYFLDEDGNKRYIYDCVRYRDEIIHLYLDE